VYIFLFSNRLHVARVLLEDITLVFTNFLQIFKLSGDSRHQKGDIRHVPFKAPTNIRRHHTSFSCNGDLAPGICAPVIS
jgi:hypothetical protein